VTLITGMTLGRSWATSAFAYMPAFLRLGARFRGNVFPWSSYFMANAMG
jgi:hypothetical protein